MDIGALKNLLRDAHAEACRATVRLLLATDVCYPGLVGHKERAELENTRWEVARAYFELTTAAEHVQRAGMALAEFLNRPEAPRV